MTASESTRDSPTCATAVLLDNSGSMLYEDLYIKARRMALALDSLIRSEYPGDWLCFIKFDTFAKLLKAEEVASLTPPKVTIYDPVIRLRADMTDKRIVRSQIPQQFTNIQHGLQLARKLLVHQDTSKRQIVLITDGLPTAHFEDNDLYLLYPPDARTEKATLREGQLCGREGITINIICFEKLWWQSAEDVQFALDLSDSSNGRAFFINTSKDLDCSVMCEKFEQWRAVRSD